MQWSKLKKNIESFFADSVKGRVELRSTRYHDSHDDEGRGYIVVDKEEIANFCSISKWQAESKVSNELRVISGATDFMNPEHKTNYYAAIKQTDTLLNIQGIHSQYGFYEALKDYLELSIDDALASDNTIIKALAILDRRLGKRRLLAQKNAYLTPEFMHKLFEFRCAAEGIKTENTKT